MKTRILSLQGLRGIAFLGIFLCHCKINIFSGFGAASVSVFFCLSGFLMVFNYYKNTKVDINNIIILSKKAHKNNILLNKLIYSTNFAKKRIQNLYLLHLITTLIASALTIYYIIVEKSPIIPFLLKLFSNIMLIQSYIPNMDYYFALNGVSWFLSCCTLMYFVFPFVLSKIRNFTIKQVKNRILLLFLSQISISIISYIISNLKLFSFDFTHWFTYIFPPSRLIDFLLGCFVGAVFLNKQQTESENNKCNKYLYLILLVFLLSQYVYQNSTLLISSIKYTLIFSPISLYIIYNLAFENNNFSKILSLKPFVVLGNISAYTFLIHQLVIIYTTIIFTKFLNLGENRYLITIISFIITLICTKTWTLLNTKIGNKDNNQTHMSRT